MGAQIVLYPDGGTSYLYISQPEYAAMILIYFSVFALYAFDVPLRIVNRATVFLGTISYSLYLVHKFVCKSLIIPYLEGQLGMNFWVVVFLVCLPTVILLAAMITYWVEKPALQFIRDQYKKVSRKEEKAAETTPQSVKA